MASTAGRTRGPSRSAEGRPPANVAVPRGLLRPGAAGVLKEGGTAWVEAVQALIESAGGKVETVYWVMGSDDFLMIRIIYRPPGG